MKTRNQEAPKFNTVLEVENLQKAGTDVGVLSWNIIIRSNLFDGRIMDLINEVHQGGEGRT